jgi:Xaa-Pro aminopeptidase
MLTTRLSEIKKVLTQNQLEASLISSLSNIIYLTDFHHFTDIEREAFILITKTNQYIFTDARYSHAVKTHVKNFKLLETSATTPFTKLLQKIIVQEKINLLGIEEDNVTIEEYKKILSAIKKTRHFDLKTLRIKKQKEEIEKIKKACAIGDKAFSYILKKIKLGMTEKEIAFLLETFMGKHGCKLSFPTIVAFAENAAIPHHKTGNRKLNKNEFILIDFGVKYEEYCSDMTRTFFFGKANKEQRKVYQTVLTAQQKAIEYITLSLLRRQESMDSRIREKDIVGSHVDNVAREYIVNKGYPTIPHSLGHGIGLQVHEAPSLSPNSQAILADAMVFSIEPGIYLPDKFGVRIEDIFTIQNGKLVQLTMSPKKLLELLE